MPKPFSTPEDRFNDLHEFNYSPHYISIKGANIHYIDEGEGNIILCLHGNLMWSYCFRHLISEFSTQYRVIAPDFIGFGKSDKYENIDDYSYELHLEMLLKFVRHVDVQNGILIMDNWGAMLGLRMLAEEGSRFERVVIMNTYLLLGDKPLSNAFSMFKWFVTNTPDFAVSTLIDSGMYKNLTHDTAIAYDAPFFNDESKAGIRAFAELVPDNPNHPAVSDMKIARNTMTAWQKPTLLIYAEHDRVLESGYKWFQRNIPGKVTTALIKKARHFMLEDNIQDISACLKDFLSTREGS